MKNLGYVLLVIGGLLVLGGLNTAFTKYDLNSSHDLSKLFGGLGVSAVLIVAGLMLVRKGKR
jgi:hypothetical protein